MRTLSNHHATHRMIIQYHPEIGHLYVPRLRARIPSESGGYFLQTNSQGFRSDSEFTTSKNGLPRLVFLGDSFTAGDGCSNEQRFSELVGRELNAEVYNYAVSGSGTEQQFLIFDKFVRAVEANLIVWCIYVENIERIMASHRESIDRSSGQTILIPKPYFVYKDNELQLQQVPVPRERPLAKTANGSCTNRRGMFARLRNGYRRVPWLHRLLIGSREKHPWLWSKVYRTIRFDPYPAYLSEATPDWKLMRAIVGRVVDQLNGIPLLIAPIPELRYYLYGLEPRYQKLFETLASPQRGVYVADLTRSIGRLSLEDRRRLSFRDDPHFSPWGHQQVAEFLGSEICNRKLISPKKSESGPASRTCRTAPRKPCYILGISCFYHNSAASLIRDGRIVAAAEEERFTRIKNDPRLPRSAINYCLEEGGICQNDLAAIVYYDNPVLTFERLLHTQLASDSSSHDSWLRVMPSWLQYKLHVPRLIRNALQFKGLVLQDLHHRSHAASAFYPSPFRRAAVLTVDGVGEWATATIGVGRDGDLEILKETHFPHSLGLLYSAFTQFTGFNVNSGEYKMMGLAPYGKPLYVDKILKHVVKLNEDGSIQLNMDYFAFLSQPSMTSEKMAGLFGGPARRPDGRITRREMDLARSIQVVTEEALLRMARFAYQITGEKKLCLAGGVALNCVANGRLLREGPFEDIWIQPAAGDAGGSLGAALDAYHVYFKNPRQYREDGRAPQGDSAWGPSFSDDEIRAYLETHGYPYEELSAETRSQRVAHCLQAGNVVGHFSGRMEFGPRSLGNRAILSDPRNPETQANLNLKIKFRESFRPFAPAILAERASEYFEIDRESPYMLLVAPVQECRRQPFTLDDQQVDLLQQIRQTRSDIPAVTHVDYSARVQTVHAVDHPHLYGVLQSFSQLTDCPLVVNTSFNIRGEPIVCTPSDAYRCFMRTNMDVLVLGRCLLLKSEQPPSTYAPPKNGEIKEDDEDEEQVPVALTRRLKSLFDRYVVPLARELNQQGTLLVATNSERPLGQWLEHPFRKSGTSIFEFSTEFDKTRPDPVRAAAAMLSMWSPGASQKLRPLLEKLIRLSYQFAECDDRQQAKEISNAIYVMH